MTLKWIDKKSVLKVGKQLFKAGDIVPDEELTEKRIELFESLGQLERVENTVIEKPEKKTRKSRKKNKLDDTGVTEETSGPLSEKPEEAENNDAGPEK